MLEKIYNSPDCQTLIDEDVAIRDAFYDVGKKVDRMDPLKRLITAEEITTKPEKGKDMGKMFFFLFFVVLRNFVVVFCMVCCFLLGKETNCLLTTIKFRKNRKETGKTRKTTSQLTMTLSEKALETYWNECRAENGV